MSKNCFLLPWLAWKLNQQYISNKINLKPKPLLDWGSSLLNYVNATVIVFENSKNKVHIMTPNPIEDYNNINYFQCILVWDRNLKPLLLDVTYSHIYLHHLVNGLSNLPPLSILFIPAIPTGHTMLHYVPFI